MRGKTLLILLALVALVAAAIFLMDAPAERGGDAAQARIGQPLFPDLKDKLNDVTALTVTSEVGQVSVTRDGEQWHVAAKDGYPADFDTVRRTLIAVSDLGVLEAKTAKPELFGKLGVEDPAGAEATSTLLTLQGADGKPLAALVVGKPGPGRDTLYVRRATENLSWLVRGPLAVPRTASQWIDLHLPKLDPNRVKDVTVTHADGDAVTVAREKKDDAIWDVQDMGADMQPSSPTVGRVLAAALESVDFEDVRAAATAPLAGESQAVTTFTTFDGLRLTVTSAVADGKTWFTFAASQLDTPAPPATDAPATDAVATDAAAETVAADAAAAAAVTKEVADLNARLSNWVYALPDYRANNLRKHKSDLVQPVPPPTEPGPDVQESETVDFSVSAPDDGTTSDEHDHADHDGTPSPEPAGADEPPPAGGDAPH